MPGTPDSFSQFLLWERSSRDTLEVKRLYIDMASDLVAGVVLSQIVYWHLPSREGRARLQVEREGKLWLAKSREEWWDECRISPKQADRALVVLEERGLIEVRLFKFGKAPRKHIRILHDEFLRAWKAEVERPGGGGDGEGGPPGSDFDQRSKSMISTKGQNRFSPKVNILDIYQRVISLDTETTTETTSAAGKPESQGSAPESAADAALVDELVSNGVGRSAALRFAREKPEVSHRCLGYLPFAKFKTTKGAWLANAIRDEYGPPPGYEAKERQKARETEARDRAAARMARQKHGAAIREENAADLGLALGRLEETQGEALRAFLRYVEGERLRTDRVAVHLSPCRRQEILSAFDTPERKLALFEAWLKTGPVPSPDAGGPPPPNGEERALSGT